MSILRTAALGCLPFVLSTPAIAQREAGTARAWEHESSDLAVDPRIHFGKLDNGLRYAWMKNSEPKERCYVRLHVDVGSLAERDAERGMAHFLEHMAFNGSRNFAPDTLVEWFQEHGMRFGADLNAFTSFSQTVYQLDLAHSDAGALAEGLTVLRDWADGLLLEEEQVQKEKGVVDGEDTESDSAGRRLRDRIFQEQYTGTRYPDRLPIGVAEARDGFDAENVRAFYERWYRPENMTLILVGDLGELDPEPLIRKAFEDLAAPEGRVEPEPPIGEPELVERTFSVFEPELPTVTIQVERLVRYADEPDTAATRTDDLDLACARSMLNLRFSELAKQPGTAFLSARVASAGGLEVYDGENLVVTAEPAKWRAALDTGVSELRRALEFGFQEAELAEVRADWLRGLDEAVERERTQSSGGLVSGLVTAAEERYVPTNAEVDRALVGPVVRALTVEACHAAFVEAWKEGVLNLSTLGNLDLGDEGVEQLTAAYTEAWAREVERRAEIATATFAYASDPGELGEIVAERHLEDLDTWLFTFANGVRLNVKATDFKERQILVSARLGEGLLSVAPEQFALGWVGVQAFGLGGLEAHSEDELRRLLAGRNVGVGFDWGDDAFGLGGATTDDDLLLELELLAARLAHPGWRDDGVRLLQDRVPLIYDSLRHVSSGPLVLEFLPALFHGDPRFCELPSQAAVAAVTIEAVKQWLAPQVATGPLEVTIVGDLDVEAVKLAAARTLGRLPKRRAREVVAERLVVAPPAPGLRMTRSVDTDDEKSFVFIVFPTNDGLETERRRSLRFLGQVVNDRLRIEVRERLGAAYSPQAGSDPNTVFPGVGLLQMQSNVDPGKVETFVSACLAVAQDLAENGVTAEELERLAEPVRAQIRDAKRQNGYWLGVLEEAQSRPSTLDDFRSVEAYYAKLDPERFSALAAKYLDPERASVLVVNPAGRAEPETPAGAGDPLDASAPKEE